MGIDYDGGMIVGTNWKNITFPEGVAGNKEYEWINKNGMDTMTQYYDAGPEYTIVGFLVDDILVEVIEKNWLKEVKKLAVKFEELTGAKAYLIGTQDIW